MKNKLLLTNPILLLSMLLLFGNCAEEKVEVEALSDREITEQRLRELVEQENLNHLEIYIGGELDRIYTEEFTWTLENGYLIVRAVVSNNPLHFYDLDKLISYGPRGVSPDDRRLQLYFI